jgi:Short C-terminal domain
MFRKRTEKLLSGMGIDPTLLGYQATLQRVMANGVEMPATIRSFTPGAPSPGVGQSVHLEMEIEPPDGAPYPASFAQPLPPAIVSTLAPGQRVTVKVVKDDPQAVMLWNTPHAAGGADPDTGRPLAPSGGDRIARLEKLQQLRTSGVLSDEEFQAQKATILGS